MLNAPVTVQDSPCGHACGGDDGPRPRHLLVVDGERTRAQGVRSTLARVGLRIDLATTLEQALDRLRERSYHVVLVEAQLPEQSGLRLVSLLRAASPSCACLVQSAAPTVAAAVAALKSGAADFLVAPLPPALLRQKVYELLDAAPPVVLSSLVAAERSAHCFAGIIGGTPSMQQLFERIAAAAPRLSPVLITGEPGTGKDLVAQALHHLSQRRGPLLKLSPAGLPTHELMLQLYGQERSGDNAVVELGLLDRAHSGTLILDDVSQLDAGGQRCLRQLLSEPVYARRGSAELRRAQVRVIAMSSRPLLQLVQRGAFCEALFHRLSTDWLDVPPLRQRRDDIPLLAAAFLTASAPPHGHGPRELPPDTLLRLYGHGWPGNVRELRELIERAALLGRGPSLLPALIDKLLVRTRAPAETTLKLGTTMAAAHRDLILMTLAAVDGNKKDAAALLGLSRGALYSRLRVYSAQARAQWRDAQQRVSQDALRDSDSHANLAAVKPGL